MNGMSEKEAASSDVDQWLHSWVTNLFLANFLHWSPENVGCSQRGVRKGWSRPVVRQAQESTAALETVGACHKFRSTC